MPQQQRAEETRARIMQAAMECFAQNGYDATGVAKIYVREHSRMAGSEEINFYKLAGIVDLTQSDKGVERTPWGLIKALYR